MENDTDKYVIRCNSFYNASKYASENGWMTKEWAWMPAYSFRDNIQIFERVE